MDDYDEHDYDCQSVIDSLIDEIQIRNLEIVALRYLISNYMEEPCKETMRAEIYSSLDPTSTYFDDYVEKYLNGHDPFDSEDYWKQMKDLARGKITDRHPLVYLSGMKYKKCLPASWGIR